MSNYIPDPKYHLIASCIKSVIRIFGYAAIGSIPVHGAVLASILLILSEVIGIVEELV